MQDKEEHEDIENLIQVRYSCLMSIPPHAHKDLSSTATFVPPGHSTVTSPGSYGTWGWLQRKIHFASSGLALTQPREDGSP